MTNNSDRFWGPRKPKLSAGDGTQGRALIKQHVLLMIENRLNEAKNEKMLLLALWLGTFVVFGFFSTE